MLASCGEKGYYRVGLVGQLGFLLPLVLRARPLYARFHRTVSCSFQNYEKRYRNLRSIEVLKRNFNF